MNPNYEKSLNKAAECTLEDIKKLRGHADKENASNNLVILADFIEYAKNNIEYLNPFEFSRFTEPCISKFLCWLLNVNGAGKESIQYKFCLEFLKLIREQEKNDENDHKKFIYNLTKNDKNDEILESIALNAKSECEKNKFDIFLTSEYAKNKKIYFVIENKKRAKLSISKDKGCNNKKWRIQLERYCKICQEDKDIDYASVKFVYLCAYKSDTEKKIIDRLYDMNIEDKSLMDNLCIDNGNFSDDKQNNISWLLGKFNYTLLEHKEVVLRLYNIYFDYINKDKNIENDPAILNLIKEYIEYWELHCDTGYLKDNLYGYSKIINGKYIEDVCEEIYDNSELFNSLEEKIQLIIKKMILYREYNKGIGCLEISKINQEKLKILDGDYGFYKSGNDFEFRFVPIECDGQVPTFIHEGERQPILTIAAESIDDINNPRIEFCIALAPPINEEEEELHLNLFNAIKKCGELKRKKYNKQKWYVCCKEQIKYDFQNHISDMLNEFNPTSLIKKYKQIIQESKDQSKTVS